VHREPPRTSRRRAALLLAGIVALVIAVALAIGVTAAVNADKPEPLPSLPANVEPLGTHLHDLLESVTP
jgi:hypothetical protein